VSFLPSNPAAMVDKSETSSLEMSAAVRSDGRQEGGSAGAGRSVVNKICRMYKMLKGTSLTGIELAM